MKAWAKTYLDNKHVKFLVDGSRTYTRALGPELDLSKKGLGVQSKRTAGTKGRHCCSKTLLIGTPGADVYADASPMVISVLNGYNVCIFAYGQTGTGKTFTMEGNKENRGVNYRTLEELFKIAKERTDTFTYDISVSVLEV